MRDFRTPLTERQSCVAALILLGLSNRQIALATGDNVNMVAKVSQAVYKKLGVNTGFPTGSRMGLVRKVFIEH